MGAPQKGYGMKKKGHGMSLQAVGYHNSGPQAPQWCGRGMSRVTGLRPAYMSYGQYVSSRGHKIIPKQNPMSILDMALLSHSIDCSSNEDAAKRKQFVRLQVYCLGLQVIQSRLYLHTLGHQVCVIYILGARGLKTRNSEA